MKAFTRYLNNFAKQPTKNTVALLITSGFLYGILFAGLGSESLAALAFVQGVIIKDLFDSQTNEDKDDSTKIQ